MSLTLSGSDFSTCEISDALLKLGVPHGGYIPDIHRISPHPFGAVVRLCGPAYTVRLVLASERDAPKLPGHFVDLASEGTVAFICAPPGQPVYLHTPSAFDCFSPDGQRLWTRCTECRLGRTYDRWCAGTWRFRHNCVWTRA